MKLKKFSIIAVVSGLILLIISLLPVFLNENYRFRENDWNFCMFLFAVAFIVTGVCCLLWRKAIEENCTVSTSLLSLGISAVAAKLWMNVIFWFAVLIFIDFGSLEEPFRYQFNLEAAFFTVALLIALIVLYVKERRKRPSKKGVGIDIGMFILYWPAFFFSMLSLYAIFDR